MKPLYFCSTLFVYVLLSVHSLLIPSQNPTALILHVPDICGALEPYLTKKKIDAAVSATRKKLTLMRKGGLAPTISPLRLVHRDDELGFYLLHALGCFSFEKVRDLLQTSCKQHGICCSIDRDSIIQLTESTQSHSHARYPWHHQWLNYSQSKQFAVADRFTLHQLAPGQGKGVTIVLIDTGVAAFKIKNNNSYIRHPDLTMSIPGDGFMNLNLVNYQAYSFLDTLRLLLKDYVAHAFLLSDDLEKEFLFVCRKWWQEPHKDEYLVAFLKKYLHLSNYVYDISQQKIHQLKEKIRALIQSLPIGFLTDPYNHYALVSFLPAPRIGAKIPLATHGTHIFGLLAAQPSKDHTVQGIAPQADVIMIKAFDHHGMSRKSTLIAALKKAASLSADIVNLSLKIADRIDTDDISSQALEHMVSLFPYVVAASGNQGDPNAPGYQGAYESYPARFECVTFDVGSCGQDGNTLRISPFSQYEPDYGPLCVTPGENIISTDIAVHPLVRPSYAMRTGTSMAAALMSGLVALVVGEYKNSFSKNQIVSVCYHAMYKPDTTDDWEKKVVLGVFDARAALLVLRCLNVLKKNGELTDFDTTMQQLFFLLSRPELIKGTTVDAVVTELLNAFHTHSFPSLHKKLPVRVQRRIATDLTTIDPWVAHAQKKIVRYQANKMPLP